MFGKKKENKANVPAVDTAPAEADIIVHNMPSSARLGGNLSAPSKASDGGFGLSAAPQKQNFKAVGLAIMVFGVVVIGVLTYLSYRFIISPAAGNKVAEQPVVKESPKPATTTAAIVPAESATTTIVATTTPAVAVATTTPTEGIEAVSDQGGVEFPPVLDSDSDGLTDDEEALLGTSATSTDSDGDKYSDRDELLKGYDPASAGKLAAAKTVAEYSNKTYNYTLLYPKDWESKSLADDATVVFVAPDDSLIQVSVQENSDKAGILGWYESSFPDATATYDQLSSGNGWDGVMGADSLNFYLTDSKHKNIYVISYIPAVAERPLYPNIFRMMINSLVIK